MRRERSILRVAVTFVVAVSMVAGLVPAPALAEAVEEASGVGDVVQEVITDDAIDQNADNATVDQIPADKMADAVGGEESQGKEATVEETTFDEEVQEEEQQPISTIATEEANDDYDITNAQVSVIQPHYVTGEPRCPEPHVWYTIYEAQNSQERNIYNVLKKDVDYTLEYADNVNAGEGSVTIRGIGSYSGVRTEKFELLDDFSEYYTYYSSPMTCAKQCVYTGKEITPPIYQTGKIWFVPYFQIIDQYPYTVEKVEYSNNVNVGTATAVLTGAVGWKKTVEITISPADISKVTVGSIANQTYTGSKIEPSLNLTYNGMTLVKGKDYDVTYSNNIDVGTATATITCKGNYSGTTSVSFNIVQANPSLKFASAAVTKSIADAPFTNALTATTDGTVSFSSSNTNVATVDSAGKVTVKGIGTATITATAAAGKNYKAGSATYTLTVTKAKTYAVSYDANGGTGAPSSQTKVHGAALTLSGARPAKEYVISYNAAGGSVSPASKSVGCTFRGWNTKRDGSGTSYAPGASYAADAEVTLYAQWSNPTAGTLATPRRSGFEFAGWYTSATGGSRVGASTTVTGRMTVYARWTDPYNMGDETYSFRNYGDSDSPGGHCFGMSMTSAGYHSGSIDISRVGGSASKYLYSLDKTKVVTEPICRYQGIQGSYSKRATVAGGSYYLTGTYDIASDWRAVVDYVKGHGFDNKGTLQIGFRKSNQGGHAINFLRYESVNGQDRIYAYDNNFPDRETYFYRDGYGRVLQAPVQTFSGAIDCIALRDVRTYFKGAGDFDAAHVLYVAKDAAVVKGYTFSYMESDGAGTEYVMYEIPANKDKVTIVPSEDNADFIYMDTEYSFGKITDDTRGELRLASSDEGASGSDAGFEIYETSNAKPKVTLSKTKYTYNGSVRKPTVSVKVGGTTLNEKSDYVVTYPAGMVKAGKYTIKVTLTGRYSGTVSKSFTITKAAQPMKLKAVKRTAKLAKVKKKAVTVAAPLKFTKKAQGKVTYAKVAKGSAKCLTVNKKTGKVTVKKGTKKGTYKVKIKVTAKGNANYKAGSKTVTCKVVVK